MRVIKDDSSNVNIVLVLGSIFLCVVSGFETYAQGQSPRLFDSYGVITGTSEAEMARLDNFDFELKKDPASKTYIVGYNGRDDPPGQARRYVLRAKTYLVEIRGVEPNRIVTVEGGRRKDFVVELWIVPQGAHAPMPAPTIPEPSDLGDNLLYDAYSLGYDSFGQYEDAEARLDGFAARLKKEPASWGCIIAYAQNGDDKIGIEWDSSGTAKKIAQDQKNYLVKRHRFAPSKLSAVDGGYSEGRTVELWIMRPRARFDKGPFVYTHRLKAGREGTLTIDNRDTTDVCCRACVRGRAQPNNSFNPSPR